MPRRGVLPHPETILRFSACPSQTDAQPSQRKCSYATALRVRAEIERIYPVDQAGLSLEARKMRGNRVVPVRQQTEILARRSAVRWRGEPRIEAPELPCRHAPSEGMRSSPLAGCGPPFARPRFCWPSRLPTGHPGAGSGGAHAAGGSGCRAVPRQRWRRLRPIPAG